MAVDTICICMVLYNINKDTACIIVCKTNKIIKHQIKYMQVHLLWGTHSLSDKVCKMYCIVYKQEVTVMADYTNEFI